VEQGKSVSLLERGSEATRPIDGDADNRSEKKQMSLCNGADIGCVIHRQHYRTRKRADFSTVLHTKELDQSAHEAKQMTTAIAVGAVSREAAEWYAINWPTIHHNVRRLQVRIVQLRTESC
jgi:hypothetical protein